MEGIQNTHTHTHELFINIIQMTYVYAGFGTLIGANLALQAPEENLMCMKF